MTKKATETESQEMGDAPKGTGHSPVLKMTSLTLDFGREDLNLMRDKINELIEKHG